MMAFVEAVDPVGVHVSGSRLTLVVICETAKGEARLSKYENCSTIEKYQSEGKYIEVEMRRTERTQVDTLSSGSGDQESSERLRISVKSQTMEKTSISKYRLREEAD